MEKISPQGSAEYANHEQVYKFKDKDSGLVGFVAIHSTALGPAVGGTRMFPYATEQAALADALKLSKAMSYKCALAGVPYGGGKAVIIGDPENDKTEALIRAYAKKINELAGQFFTGEDVGLLEADVQIMLTESDYFIGDSNAAGDPSPWAALSVFKSMQVAAGEIFGSEELHDRKVAIKGVGKVGGELARLLEEVGAKIFMSDIKDTALTNTVAIAGSAEIAANDGITNLAVDFFSPCALGNDINDENWQQINAKIICGGANNQLSDSYIGDKLFDRGILYVPDYVANSGGLINVVDELEEGGYKKDRVIERVDQVKDTVRKILDRAKKKNISTTRVADELAEEIFNN